jgi:alkylation response protein AidB-like acyl-CoA dehydrogenase
MSDLLISPKLLSFQLFDWLEVGDSDVRETYDAVIDMALRLAADSFLPHHRQSDIDEPWLDEGQVRILPAAREAMVQVRDAGLFGATFPEALGGLELPSSIGLALGAIFSSANIATWAYPLLTAANARLIVAFGSAAQVDTFARPEIEGRWFGTMCMSEPQAGSSLGDVRTRAVHDGQDELGERYRLTGNKMWISGGDQDASENIVHLVLAKAARPDGTLPEGSKGLSLFIVPKWLPDGTRNDVAVAGLNHKLGMRGTPNCLLNLGEKDGAIGWRVGAEGQGIAQMFMMMNEARVGVGMGAAAMAYRGYRHALRYAQERLQGRPAGVTGGAPVPIIEHPDVRRMLLAQKAYAEGAIAICLYCANLMDQGTDEAETVLALLTPIAKAWPSEFGLIANDLAIQTHGGYGYTRDFDVEMIWRDNRLNPIHEGTTAIQGMDLLGRKLLRSDGSALAALRARIARTVERAASDPALAAHAAALGELWDHIAQVLETLRGRDPARALDDATLFLRGFGHGVIGWLWLDQALSAADHPDTDLAEGVRFACRFFFEEEVPQAEGWLRIVATPRDAAVTIPVGAFG